ncbi:MAG TPA: hypothetical protein VEK09_07480 [Jatrophihabitantaceae bacterium]|nr:hypothetical protein [Jatrophihabitantaceae bacterium]
MDGIAWPVIGVVGSCGGVGASTFAAVLAAVAGLRRRSVLVDLEPVAGGIDVLVGLEGVPGARWSGLLLGGGRLDPLVLVDGLPHWSSVAVLSADVLPEPDAVSQLLAVACRAGPVVVDLGRWDSPARAAAVPRCTLTVLVCGGDVRSVTGGRVVRSAFGDRPIGVVVSRSRGGVAPARRVAELIDAPLIGVMRTPPRRGDVPLDPRSPPRAMTRVASGVLDAVRQGAADD